MRILGYHASHWIVILLLAVLLVKSVVLFYAIPKFTDIHPHLYLANIFPDDYDKLALNMIQGKGYRVYQDTGETLLRSPGYPLFLAGIFFLCGKSLDAVKCVNLALSLLTAVILILITRKFFKSGPIPIIAALLFLFHPATLLAESRGGVEVLFTDLLVLFVLRLYRALENQTHIDYVLAGCVLGGTCLVKSTPILFPAFLFIYLFLGARRGFPSKFFLLTRMVTLVAAMLVVLAPWVVRNYNLTGNFVPTATLLGVVANQGLNMTQLSSIRNDEDGSLFRKVSQEHNHTALASNLGLQFKPGYFQYFFDSKEEAAFNDYLLWRTWHTYKKSPQLFLRTLRINAFHFWFGGRTKLSTRLNMIVQLPFLTLSVAGLYLLLRKRQVKAFGPIMVVILYFVAVHMPLIGVARHSVPLIPFLSILAATTLYSVSMPGKGTPKESCAIILSSPKLSERVLP